MLKILLNKNFLFLYSVRLLILEHLLGKKKKKLIGLSEPHASADVG